MTVRYCQCNCGATVKKDFAKGHYVRVWNIGRPDYHLRPKATSKLKRNPCKCGCGAVVRDSFKRGHGRNRVAELAVRRKISASLKAHFKANPTPKPAMHPCRCGCGNFVKMDKTFVLGHNVRVDHNSKWPEVKKKRRTNTLRLWANGVLRPGMVDPVVRLEAARKISERLKRRFQEDAAYRDMTCRKLKKARAKSTGIFQKGSAHAQWKGGITPLSNMVHGSYELARLWKQPILKRDKHTCKDCGSKERKGLHVHHDVLRMAEIVRMFVPKKAKAKLSAADMRSAYKGILEYHVEEKVSGVTLCKVCHDLRHELEGGKIMSGRKSRDAEHGHG